MHRGGPTMSRDRNKFFTTAAASMDPVDDRNIGRRRPNPSSVGKTVADGGHLVTPRSTRPSFLGLRQASVDTAEGLGPWKVIVNL